MEREDIDRTSLPELRERDLSKNAPSELPQHVDNTLDHGRVVLIDQAIELGALPPHRHPSSRAERVEDNPNDVKLALHAFRKHNIANSVHVVRDGAELPGPIAHIAPDPFEAAFDPAGLARRLRTRHTGVKRALLDQSLISGVGNIYADEALWRARLHWARPTETLNGPEVSRLLAAVREVLGEALVAGGTSFDDMYVNVHGESGYFERSLAVYGREGFPCLRCGTPVRRDSFMNRSAYTCPRCQPRPRRARL